MTIDAERPIPDVPVLDFTLGDQRPVLGNARRIDEVSQLGPILRSSWKQGFWVITDADMIREALWDAATFSSSATLVTDPNPPYLWIPQMLDPPRHTAWRHHLGPYFAPGNPKRLEDSVHHRCVQLLEDMAERGSCDFTASSPSATPHRSSWTCSGCPSRSWTSSWPGNTRSCT